MAAPATSTVAAAATRPENYCHFMKKKQIHTHFWATFSKVMHQF
jgi:hypothetical protein